MKKSQFTSLSQFMTWSAKMAAKPITFVIALSIVLIWFIICLIYGFSDTLLLIMDTLATINASLMVFIIQNTQSRDTKALHIKLDELIRAVKEAEDELIAIEDMEEDELEYIRKKLHQKVKQSPKKG